MAASVIGAWCRSIPCRGTGPAQAGRSERSIVLTAALAAMSSRESATIAALDTRGGAGG